MQPLSRLASAAIAALSTLAVAEAAGVINPLEIATDVEVASTIHDTQIGRASWSTVCGDGCSLGCSDACRGDVCCGDGCNAHCGADVCGGGAPCCNNCGLFGHGVLTYDSCSDGCPLPELLLGCISCPTEPCFDDFISPMTNPLFFEDPRITTELRGIFWQHKVPATAGGGDVNLYAVQIRARLTERLGLIAAKDGYVVSTNPLIDDGWADVSLGLKYALLRDARNQRLASAGFTYELPVGSGRTLQANGDGLFHLFLTGGTRLCDCGHWLSGFGGVIPVDDQTNSHFLYWSNHFDYQFRKGWYALAEFNWFHWTDGGADTLGVTGVEGFDVFNFGSAGVDGNDIVTGAFGVKYKPNRLTEIGVAWENPLTDRRDVIDNRLTVDLILRY
ncbi:hypothetical protein [Botrimarina sp.]|uniref:hypothetical protein n=1 Tax=Botrimarina sp. TaxID=2795802 RepID=UPI0032EFDBF2